jgi:hypothetical protein
MRAPLGLSCERSASNGGLDETRRSGKVCTHHRRLRALGLSISSENPPMIPASIGDRDGPRPRSGSSRAESQNVPRPRSSRALVDGSGSARRRLARRSNRPYSPRDRRQSRAETLRPLGSLPSFPPQPSIPGGDRPFRPTSPRGLDITLTIMTDRTSQRIAQLQYLSPMLSGREVARSPAAFGATKHLAPRGE